MSRKFKVFTTESFQFEIDFFFIEILKLGLKNKRNSNTMYDKVIERIEKMSELLYFALFKVTFMSGQVVTVLITLINYFFLDMGDESFQDVQLM